MLRQLPGAELLAVPWGGADWGWRAWEEDMASLPVRPAQPAASLAEAPAMLAAEADVLVLWHDAAPSERTSYAARAALASGVPILTSPVRQFRDLAEATLQPVDPLEGLGRLLEDAPLRERLTSAAHDFCHLHSWRCMARQHEAL